ncbi:MAG TPA: hypothetical protein VGB50_04660 [Flavobacterium sp.]|jgi:hypothetical protein
MKKLSTISFLLASAFSLFSCSRDEVTNPQPGFQDEELLAASTVADFVTEVDFQTGMNAAEEDSSLGRGAATGTTAIPQCPTVFVSGNDFPKTYTIDYGSGCTNNGISRSGMLTITLSGFFFANGTVITIERNNYKVNGYKIAGTVVYTNQTTGNDIPRWLRTISNGQITNPAGTIFTHTGSWMVNQIGGANTVFLLSDNVYEITEGFRTITGPGGASLTGTIVTPLIKMYACPHISQGVLNLQGVWLDGNLNYGNNTCDNQAIYTHSNGTTYNVILF